MAKRKNTRLPVVLILELVISTIELAVKDEKNPLPLVQLQRLQAVLNIMNGGM